MQKKLARYALMASSLLSLSAAIAGVLTFYLLDRFDEAPLLLWTMMLLVIAAATFTSLHFSYQAYRRRQRLLPNRITENENRLTTVLDNLISAVVMIGDREQIVLLNKTAEEMLGIQAKYYLDKHYSDIHYHEELKRLMQKCIGSKEIIREELVIQFPEKRVLDVNMVPISPDRDHWSGMIIVLHDISEIRRLERIRSEFVANVSHELKTPIAAVKGFAETLLSGAVNDPDTAKSFLQIIHDESERLNRLILNILDLSKIESKQAPLQLSPIELHQFLDKTISMMEPEAEKKNIRLTMQADKEIYIEADEDRLQQVVLNLISNGISYTGEGGSVHVSVRLLEADEDRVQEEVEIVVEDNGIGIPERDLPRIFERFYRVDKARSRSSGGTGLGLSIVKHIIDLHRGTIHVESKVGEGSRFIIRLPVIQYS